AGEPRLELLKCPWVVNARFRSMSIVHLPILHLGVTCVKWIPTIHKICLLRAQVLRVSYI
ncbi:MAG: hypothetical protein ACREA4_12325, partial [Nitrososphaera sp.]